MSQSPLTNLRIVAQAIEKLEIDFVFIGGTVVELLLDKPELTAIRPTDDVDVVLGVVTKPPYDAVEARLREFGFQHDVREGAPKCRWVYNQITVDTMPIDGAFMGLNTAWFKEALESAVVHELDGVPVPVIAPAAFLATKLAAFRDRGERDYYASKDLEDVVTVIDGREAIHDDIIAADANMCAFVGSQLKALVEDADFMDALSGLLPSDVGSQRRLSLLEDKLRKLSAL